MSLAMTGVVAGIGPGAAPVLWEWPEGGLAFDVLLDMLW